MSAKPTFVVQTFERKRGRLVPTAKEIAPSESGARKKAEAVAGRMPGSAAISIVVDAESGEVQAATILGTWGEVPEDFAESLLAG